MLTADSRQNLAERVRSHPLWYHSLDLAPGVTTPGWFDLRPMVDNLPWPAVAGRRCIDIGTYDGFLAFELERRGAAEVWAVDIADHDRWDWPPDVRARGGEELARLAGPDKGAGFRLAAEALDSSVRREEISIYELDPAVVGTFDVVVCGSLLLHLRDPLRALEAVRGVTGGVFLSAETIDLSLTLVHPRKPVARLIGVGSLCQWWVPNAAGHRRMLQASGFEVLSSTRPYTIRHGVAHPPPGRSPRMLAQALLQRVMTRGTGVPHTAVLSRPAV